MNFPIGPNLEIQFHSGFVIVIDRILILSVNLVVIPMSFVLIRLCCAERLSGFNMYGMYSIDVHIGIGYFEKKNCNLDKQTAPYNAIKHQRDKQIFIVYRAGIQSFNLSEGYQYSSSLKKKSSLLG